MKNLVIRKLDNNNFVLAEKLNEPQTRMINGIEVIYTFKNLDRYYGNLYEAIKGYFRYLNMPIPIIDKELKTIKPYQDLSNYEKLLEVDLRGMFNER